MSIWLKVKNESVLVQISKVLILVCITSLGQGCSTPNTNPIVQSSRTFPGPESYLMGKNIEAVAQVYGNPSKTNVLGNTSFISYTGYGRRGSSYDNICFLEIQSDRTSNIIKNVSLGSNMGIDNRSFGFDVRQDCNRVFFTEKLAKP